jgi:hypothetical protein
MKNLQSVTVQTELVPCRLLHFPVSPLNSLIFCFLNVLILSVSRLHKLSKLPYTTINFTDYSHLSKVLGNVKKKNTCIINQNNIFFLFIYSLCCYEWFLFVHNLTQRIKYKQQITWWWQSQYWCNHKTVKYKIMQQNSKGIWKK